MASAERETVGVVAGAGRLPAALAGSARRAGRRVAVLAIEGLADPALEAEADVLVRVGIGELGALLDALGAAGAREVVLAGNVPKALLFANPAAIRVDARGQAFLASLGDRRDDAILRALADRIEAEGFRVVAQTAWAAALLAPEGPIGAVAVTAAQRADVAWAWPIAKALGRLDVGQTLVVKDRTVLAVEAIEGTDAAIRRGAALGRGGAVVCKVFKPGQDPRFDAPTVGPETIATLVDAGAALLAIEAGKTLVLDRADVVARADAAGIALLGVPEAGPR